MSGSSESPVLDASAEILRWTRAAARAADDKMGRDTVVIDVADVLAITDFFVITSGANRRQVRAILDEVERDLTDAGGPKPLRIEGNQENSEWVLMDYGTFVVHVFQGEARDTYALERLWGDRPTVAFRQD